MPPLDHVELLGDDLLIGLTEKGTSPGGCHVVADSA
jgi:hypothetical protein